MKITKELKDKIYDYFIGENYKGDEETADELSKLVGGLWNCYDTKIDDGIDDTESEDEYLMLSCFELIGGDFNVRIYYGDVTDEITCVSFY